MTSIKIPTPLRAYTCRKTEIQVTGETVGQALNDLITQYPDLRQHLYNGGELRNFVNVYVGSEDIRQRDGLDTSLVPNDWLRIVLGIAGG